MANARTILALALGASLPTPTLAWARKLRPVDEGPRNPSFARFRASLLRAAQRHDYDAIVRVLDPKVASSFGDEETIPAFHRLWKGKRIELYRELSVLLQLGGSFSEHGRVFSTPYVWSEWDKHGLGDNLEAGAVISARVPLRKSASAGAPVLSWLSYDVLPQVKYPPAEKRVQSGTQHWAQVKTSSGKRGYVEARHVRSVLDYRAVLTRKRGRWVITAFVAGD